MLGWKARLMLETGRWSEADTITQSLLNNPNHTSIVRVGALVTRARLVMRRGSFDEAEVLLDAAMPLALPTREGQRILPVLTAQLELCWLRGNEAPYATMLETEEALSYQRSHAWHYSEWVYWMRQCGVTVALKQGVELTPPFQASIADDWETAADRWKDAGCPYELALALFEGDEEHQKQSLRILDELGATATHAMLKSRLRLMGVRNIPRGPRESTRSNPAQLTNRQIDVLFLLEEGLQNAEIADKLFISSKTVDHHISAILSKLGMSTRAKAVTEARRLGILT
jgi:DNA-binding CsgD family transcriptional regulator